MTFFNLDIQDDQHSKASVWHSLVSTAQREKVALELDNDWSNVVLWMTSTETRKLAQALLDAADVLEPQDVSSFVHNGSCDAVEHPAGFEPPQS